MQCSCVWKHTRFLSICLEKLINSLWTLVQYPNPHEQKIPRVILNVLVLTRTYVKTLFETFLADSHGYGYRENMILNLFRHRDTESEVLLYLFQLKRTPSTMIKKINLRKLWEINFTSNTDVTHHFNVSSLGESIEIKVYRNNVEKHFSEIKKFQFCVDLALLLLDSHVLLVE